MKKITKLIITLTIILSSLSTTFAEEGYIDNLFNFNYGIEEYKLNLSNIKHVSFKNEKYNKIYRELNTVNSLLKNGLMKNYREGKYEYYQMNGIITNYNNFIYYTNQFFFYLKLKEQNKNYVEINSALKNSYINMKSSYTKVKNLIK